MAITLGKDCAVNCGGAIVGVRNVTFSAAARTIDIDEFAQRQAAVYSIGWDSSVTIEFNDNQSLPSIFSAFANGTTIQVSGGAGAWTFPAVITSIAETDPIDGVATFTVEAKLTKA